MKKSECNIMTGVLYKILVTTNAFDDNVVGFGYIVRYSDGDISHPELIDLKGDRLGEGYFQINITNQKYPVVIPMRIQ